MDIEKILTIKFYNKKREFRNVFSPNNPLIYDASDSSDSDDDCEVLAKETDDGAYKKCLRKGKPMVL